MIGGPIRSTAFVSSEEKPPNVSGVSAHGDVAAHVRLDDGAPVVGVDADARRLDPAVEVAVARRYPRVAQQPRIDAVAGIQQELARGRAQRLERAGHEHRAAPVARRLRLARR